MDVYDGERTTSALLSARASQEPDRAFIRFDDGELTYLRLDTDASRLANALLELGLEPGDKLAVMLPNGPEYLRTWFGLTRAGLVEVPINTALKGDLLAYQLDHSEARGLVIAHEWVSRLVPLVDVLPNLREVIVVGDGAEPGAIRTHQFADVLAGGSPSLPTVRTGAYDPSTILFTAGTTGPSKGAVLTHNANFRLARNVVELMAYGPDDVLFTVFPLFHVNAKYTSVLPAMLANAEVVMHSHFSASAFWDICRRERVTAFNYMGALLMMLYKQPRQPGDAENPVRRAYGAPAPVSIYADFEDRFGMQLVEVYGSTELGTATMNTVESFRVGSCGKPVPYYDVEIHDEYDDPCAPGVEGEIVVRPREPHVMVDHYYRMPEATVRAFRNLWFHTGDRGRMDEDGYFYYVDRMKDAIRRRGENISSWEVEKVVDAHDDVLESAAVGVPSELTEEEVMIVVAAKPGHTLRPESLLDHCQRRLPAFAIPRYVRLRNELPKNVAQRVEKYKLRDEGVTTDTWDREHHGYEVSPG